jgi:probable rRNA maturation factor
MPIYFFSEKISFKLKHPRKTSQWITQVIQQEKATLDTINYIFCNDEYLHTINVEYLNHNTYTDIITFDNSEESDTLASDIFISVPRVRENAKNLKVDFDIELHRVMIHGILHLLGYSDKSKDEKATMRNKENAYLSLRK